MSLNKMGRLTAVPALIALVQLSPVATTAAVAAPFTVGVFDTGNCYPALCNDSGTNVGQSIDYQQVYSASAFAGPTTINTISFLFDQQAGGASNILSGDYLISLSYAAHGVGALSTALANNVALGTQAIFSIGQSKGTDSADPIATIGPGTPFFYDPNIGDLLLEIIASNQATFPNGSGNGYFEADSTGTVTSRAFCVTNNGCYADNYGLVTEFNTPHEGNVPVPEPVTLSVFSVGFLGVAAMRRRKKVK